jgi:hypothetical protein
MTDGLCSCHSEQSEESFSILRVMGIENEPLSYQAEGERWEVQAIKALGF